MSETTIMRTVPATDFKTLSEITTLSEDEWNSPMTIRLGELRSLQHSNSEFAAEITRLTARIAELEKALTKIANCGQSQEPDHWKFRVMARDTARTTLEASEKK